MILFSNTEVLGWEHAIRGMRNPLNSWEKSDSFVCKEEDHFCRDSCSLKDHCLIATFDDYFAVGKNDYDLMKRLRNSGTDHRKFMRMLTVYVDITAPLYWWKEFDTYKVGTVANSCSTMHKIHAKEFTLDDFSCEHLIANDPDTKMTCSMENGEVVLHNCSPKDTVQLICNMMNHYRDLYNMYTKKLQRDDLTDAERTHTKSQQKYMWWQMIQLLPSSYNQKRTVQMNYEVLANIYKSRKAHKLDEWREGFCDWIKSLPYSELITGEFEDCDA